MCNCIVKCAVTEQERALAMERARTGVPSLVAIGLLALNGACTRESQDA
jgi:hypothetical protein